jgi:flavodoxin short chain
MTKTAIVYWTGSGNTEAMAQAVEEGVKNAGGEAVLQLVTDTNASDTASYDRIALGCPACGNEELDEYDFEPFFQELLPQLKGKKIAIFGSYAWNEGAWIETWKARLEEAGVTLAADPVKAYSYPDDDALEACRSLGAALAE